MVKLNNGKRKQKRTAVRLVAIALAIAVIAVGCSRSGDEIQVVSVTSTTAATTTTTIAPAGVNVSDSRSPTEIFRETLPSFLRERMRLDSLVPTDTFWGTLSFTDDDVPISMEFDRVYSRPEWPREIEPGDFVFELRDASGNAIRSVPFRVARPHVDCFDGGCDQFPPIGNFIFSINNPPEYESFAVIWEGKEIGSMERSINTPIVSIIGPPAGKAFSLDDTIDVSWDASSPDSKELFFRVYYSTNGGETYSLMSMETQETRSSMSLIGRQLDVTEQARFAVAVTDGTMGDFIESEIFYVRGKTIPSREYSEVLPVQGQPPEITLVSPYPGIVLAESKKFLMEAMAFDPDEKSNLPSDAFSWESDIDGHIDMGNPLVFSASDFTPGNHTVTVTATDSTGMSSSLFFEINITLVNEIPVANDDAVTITQGESIWIDVLGNDIDIEKDIDLDNFIVLDQPMLGSVEVSWAEFYSFLSIEYRSVDAGMDTLTYKICDGIYRCDNETVSVFGLEYRSIGVGTDTFTYKICDGIYRCDEATVTVTVEAKS